MKATLSPVLVAVAVLAALAAIAYTALNPRA
jgi:hypothetical protein